MTKKKTTPESVKPDVETRKLDEAGHPERFPVVGIGASAGGLEALAKLIDKLPAETGMAFDLGLSVEWCTKTDVVGFGRRFARWRYLRLRTLSKTHCLGNRISFAAAT